MAITLRSLLLLLLTVLSTTTIHGSDPDLVSELLSLRSSSKDGVIHLDNRLLNRYLSSSAPIPRPYSLIIFFDASQLRDRSDLHLPELRSEFALLSSAFLRRHPPNTPSHSRLFFCDIEFKESQDSFSLFGVNSLPHIRHVSPSAPNPRSSDPMDPSDFARLADSMAEFVESKTKIPIGPIERPPPISGRQIGFLLVLLLIASPFLIKRVLAGETLIHDWKFWMVSALFVYFFSVSGSMHNIIRKMPMFLTDRNDPSKLVFFYQGSGMQLGTEGFAVGGLYMIVGLLLGFLTHVLVYWRNVNVQRGVMLFALVVSFWAVKKVIFLDNWKTGYWIHGFWPNSWR
ncbi:putative dolichyl-diphosphooligosaccharide--protein glycosyltransferase subunit 3B [Acorus gramineus]|uniref:Dolichyl-diphosphooligosaccharide--protein glycosyltransferase subunit 3B n=1 Tax=Acorus gramineus TaxID=55184 RepID=A0AAV9BWJ8_ACOGR|nr:putative dolichyl-diphosphooligosaccharide--protein glycosyltransferase subunit 3B [Acorus gramineus]